MLPVRHLALGFLGALSISGTFGCELVTGADRSLIPEGTGGASGTGGTPTTSTTSTSTGMGGGSGGSGGTMGTGGSGGSGGGGGMMGTGGTGGGGGMMGTGGAGGGGGTMGTGGMTGTGGAGGGGGMMGTGGAGGGGGTMAQCTVPSDCGPTPNECVTATCTNGMCSTMNVAANTPTSIQTSGDCMSNVCDGNGGVTAIVDDTDVPSDNNQCTMDTCMNGTPTSTPEMAGFMCSQGSGSVCDGMGNCVQCNVDMDCMSGMACVMNTCVLATCVNTTLDGDETDVDCGGSCSPCADGLACMAGGDCQSGVCSTNLCQAPSCMDTVKNGDETDVDCGGSCGPCADGSICQADADCASGFCVNQVCANTPSCAIKHVFISEIRTRGVGGANDEFIELFNPTPVPVTLDTTWKLEARSATGSQYSARWAGVGKTIAPGGHYLIVGTAYSQMPAGDDVMGTGVSDATSVRLVQGGSTVDAVCYYFDTTTLNAFSSAGFSCEGTPVDNLPHDNSSNGNVDASIERKPGGMMGNCTDTDDNANDFLTNVAPSDPQSTQSPTMP